MRFAEFQNDAVADLIVVLRNKIRTADAQGQAMMMSWPEVTELMADHGHDEYDYDTFKNMYDTNPDLQSIVANFNGDGITLGTKEKVEPDTVDTDVPSDQAVDKMAKRAASKEL